MQSEIPFYGVGKGPTVTQSMCFNPKKKFQRHYGNNLPHWQQLGTLTFITFRLADSLPQVVLKEIESIKQQWLNKYPEPWTEIIKDAFRLRVSARYEQWLDAGYGSCCLNNPDARAIVINTLNFYDSVHYDLYDYVVMPNHVHIILRPYTDIYFIVQAIRRFSTRQINKLFGRTGPLWQNEWFDHLIRSVEEYREKSYYIRHNPDVLRFAAHK